MQILKQSTAATVLVGPVLDSAGLAITTAVIGDFQLTKNGTTAALASPATATHSHNGNYLIALSTDNTDTAGRLVITVNNSAQAMGTHRYTVLVASVFDAIITNATNTTGGLPTATGAISALAGAVSTLTAGGVRTELTTELGRIDVTTSSRMASYTQPTGFLASTFPGTVASPTNITSASGIVLAGVTHTGAVIPTVTDVTTKTGYTATVSDKTGFSLLAGTGLGNQTANITGSLSGSVGSVTGAVGSVAAGVTVSDKTGFKLASDGLALVTAWTVGITGNITGNLSGSVGSVTGSVGSVTGSVGSIFGVTFPSNFAALGINTSGYLSRVVLVDTTTTNTDMRGTDGAALASQWTSTRAGYLDALSRLDSMIESDGAGQFRFDTIALSMAPAGGGGGGTDWTANERTAIRAILGVPTSGTTPTDPASGILDEIRDSVGAIGINVYPVSASTPERVAGTTLTFYRNESRSVSVVTDFTLTSLTLQFTVEDQDGVDIYTLANGAISRSSQTFTVAVTTAVTGGLGQYRWSMRDITGGGSSVIAMGVLTVQEAASNG